jgi:hypothetical protein
MMPEMIEKKDGLLADADNVIMKARSPELFPAGVYGHFHDKTKVLCSWIERIRSPKIHERIERLIFDIPIGEIDHGVTTVTVKVGEKRAVFDAELFDYVETLGIVDCYLSNIPLQGEEEEYYPLFVKYKFGWICLAPREA